MSDKNLDPLDHWTLSNQTEHKSVVEKSGKRRMESRQASSKGASSVATLDINMGKIA